MEREKFSSRFGSLVALVGSAVGLGNIWRFPFLVGEYGGGTFILLYLISAFILSFPILMCEFVIGRRSQKNAFGAFKALAPDTKWKWVGLLCVITPIIILSYYSVIGGWTVSYLFKSLCFNFSGELSRAELSGLFGAFVSSTWSPLFWLAVFAGITAIVVSKGVKSGIEKVGKIVMPVLLFLMIGMSIYCICLPGAAAGVGYVFKPDLSKITPSACAAAMGQAFMSLSLGCGIMLTFSSYLPKKDNLMKTSVTTGMLDLLFAVIAACAIIPGVFAFGLDVGQGPSLVFETLPFVFSRMHAGVIISIAFFFGLFVAALTSAISLFEVGAAYMCEEVGMTRNKACLIIVSCVICIGTVCSLSFGPLAGVKLFGGSIFDFFDSLTANYLMTIGALLSVIFVGWRMKKSDVYDELTNGATLSGNMRLFKAVYFIIRYIAPLAIILIFILSQVD